MKKKLFANGKFVCEYESTGDNDQDIIICRDLLRQHGHDAKTSEEQAIFRQAISFANTSAHIYQRDLAGTPSANGFSAVPFVVNGIFAVELYIKTLSKLHLRSLRGHDLVHLFDALPQSATDNLALRLASSAASASRWKCGITTNKELRSSLRVMRNAFQEWRYLHETDSRRSIEFLPLVFTMETFHAVCSQHPTLRAADEVPFATPNNTPPV